MVEVSLSPRVVVVEVLLLVDQVVFLASLEVPAIVVEVSLGLRGLVVVEGLLSTLVMARIWRWGVPNLSQEDGATSGSQNHPVPPKGPVETIVEQASSSCPKKKKTQHGQWAR